MNILLAFATNSGATQDAAGIVVKTLTDAGHTVTIKLAKESSLDEFSSFDSIVLASPSWDYGNEEGMPHEDFIALIKGTNGKTFEGKKFAILGLGDSSYSHFCGCVDHLEQWVKDLKGNLIVPSLRIDGYYFKSENPDNVKKWAEGLTTALK